MRRREPPPFLPGESHCERSYARCQRARPPPFANQRDASRTIFESCLLGAPRRELGSRWKTVARAWGPQTSARAALTVFRINFFKRIAPTIAAAAVRLWVRN